MSEHHGSIIVRLTDELAESCPSDPDFVRLCRRVARLSVELTLESLRTGLADTEPSDESIIRLTEAFNLLWHHSFAPFHDDLGVPISSAESLAWLTSRTTDLILEFTGKEALRG